MLSLLLSALIAATGMSDTILDGQIRRQPGQTIGTPSGTPLADPDFVLPITDSGLTNLDSAAERQITINGTTLDPVLWLEGQDAGASTWLDEAGSVTYNVSGSGTAPSTGQNSLFTDGTDSVVLEGSGKTYSGASNFSLGTKDIVLLAVVRADSGATAGNLLSNRATTGISIQTQVSSGLFRYRATIDGASIINIPCNDSITQAPNATHVVMAFFDRSGNGVCYTNGIGSTATSISAEEAADLDSGDGQPIIGGAAQYKIILIALYTCAGCMDTGAQSAVAVKTLQTIMGLYPTTATTPEMTFTRASNSYSSSYDDIASGLTLYRYGIGMPRVTEKSLGFVGYMAEGAATNELLQSEDLTTTWAAGPSAEYATATANHAAAPNGFTVADYLGELSDTHTSLHYYTQTVTTETASARFVVSSWFKDVDAGFGFLFSDGPATDALCTYNLTTGVAKVKTGTPTCACIEYASSWWRCYLADTNNSGITSNEVRVGVADDIDTTSYVGTGEGIDVFGFQYEEVNTLTYGLTLGKFPTSYVATTTAASNRSPDLLYYTHTPSKAYGHISADVWCPSQDVIVDNLGLFGLSDGTATNAMMVNLDSTDVAQWNGTATGAQFAVTGTTDIADGTERNLNAYWRATQNKIKVGSAFEGTTDYSATIPTVNKIMLDTAAGSMGAGCLVSNLKSYSGW